MEVALTSPYLQKLSANPPEQLAKIDAIQDLLLQLEQLPVATEHMFHGGMYARTVRIPEGCALTGTLIKIPTLLILHGDAEVLTGDGLVAFSGYNVLAGSALRKQVLVTRSAVEMTMVFPTQAKTVEDAEREFTDEYDKLMSHKSVSDAVLVTGE